MKTLRDLWAGASDVVRITVIVAFVLVLLAGLYFGLGLEWFTSFLATP